MKTTIEKSNLNFTPITLKLNLETYDDLLILLGTFNIPPEVIRQNIPDFASKDAEIYNITYKKIHSAFDGVFHKLKEQFTKRNTGANNT